MGRIAAVSLILLFTLIGLAGCAQGETEPAPPEIHYGQDLCSHCGMIINDARFAAGYAYEVEPGRYQSLAFDDIGDMFAQSQAHPEQKVVAYYVHDYASQEWLDATQAHYVVSPAIPSPMGFGIAAHAERAAAEAMAAEVRGEVQSWEELQAQPGAHTDQHQ